ncbi:HpaII family restriction endonuclease [Chryseobacterium sp.]|uniref:HpaII family restriction endonuclease n=1 Tax=Chryseobacterium sp. TaxID=1871047 RepID=UPI0028985CCA|nr:HpaII family restriction endonuclease [Chryseobacterium sp.]
MKGNKGEWSELYVLIKLMADGKLYQSDTHLKKDDKHVYDVIKAYKGENSYSLEFIRNDKVEIFKVNDTYSLVNNFDVLDFETFSKHLFIGIKNGKGKSFSLPNLEDFFAQCGIKSVKAKSTTKADLKLRIYDHRLAKETDLGFSIKSLIGGKSTLFNTGTGNNFIYNVNGSKDLDINKFNSDTYSPVSRQSKIACRLQTLEKNNFKVNFKEIQSKQLWRNLKMIDGDLPEILSFALYYRWIYEVSSLTKVTQLLEDKDPLNFYNREKSPQKLYEYKIKRFLTESAMGMTSETPWFGEYDSFGGVIVAKKDGDVVCFHIYDFNLFREYLINNTVFEQPATGEDEFNPGHESESSTKNYNYGWLYQEDEQLKFKINIQIRFK